MSVRCCTLLRAATPWCAATLDTEPTLLLLRAGVRTLLLSLSFWVALPVGQHFISRGFMTVDFDCLRLQLFLWTYYVDFHLRCFTTMSCHAVDERPPHVVVKRPLATVDPIVTSAAPRCQLDVTGCGCCRDRAGYLCSIRSIEAVTAPLRICAM
jgi:hypothetical protein